MKKRIHVRGADEPLGDVSPGARRTAESPDADADLIFDASREVSATLRPDIVADTNSF